MYSGKVKFYDSKKGFGIVKCPEFDDEIFVHVTSIEDIAKILLEGETVEFETYHTDKGIHAKKLRRKLERKIGIITKYDEDKGFGFIVDKNELSSSYFFHYRNVKGTETGFKRIEQNSKVEFSITDAVIGQGLVATDIVLSDTRTPLEKFVYLSNFKESIEELSKLAQHEEGDWDFINEKTGKKPVLFNYIQHTFKQILFEKKIQYDDNTTPKFACFNTSLVTENQEEIFGFFEINKKQSNNDDGYSELPKWVLFFEKESHRLRSHFSKKPEIANYFQHAAELIYDTAIDLVPDFDHILGERADRFPESIKKLSKEQQQERVSVAITSALRRVKRNYKTAIPQFYDGEIQLLLPLCLEVPNKADLALVARKDKNVYRAATVLPLDWAYNNARLLARPDREWLNP